MIKNRVYEIRTKQKLTQQELAELVGVSRQTIIALEKGSYNPSLELALKLSKVLDENVENIFTLD